MKCRAVLFDLDGTLLDTLEDLASSMNETLSRLGLPGHPTENYKHFVGEGVEYLAYSSLPKSHRDSKTLSQCIKYMRQEYCKRWDKKTHPYSGIPKLLDSLMRSGIKLSQDLRIPPKNFFYVGDTQTDMETALASGMLAIGALWGFRSQEELLSGGAKIILDHPMNLLNLIHPS